MIFLEQQIFLHWLRILNINISTILTTEKGGFEIQNSKQRNTYTHTHTKSSSKDKKIYGMDFNRIVSYTRKRFILMVRSKDES